MPDIRAQREILDLLEQASLLARKEGWVLHEDIDDAYKAGREELIEKQLASVTKNIPIHVTFDENGFTFLPEGIRAGELGDAA